MENLRTYRFELYLAALGLLLFGSLFFPGRLFESVIKPAFIMLTITAGYVLISKRKKTRSLYGVVFAVVLAFEGIMIPKAIQGIPELGLIRYGLLSLFFTLVTLEVILQVWKATQVNKNVIFGLIAGYVSLGMVAFFLLLGIYLADPGSFRGLEHLSPEQLSDGLLYYAYITLMTIGYGDIVPIRPLAQKAAVLIGLLGQFYLVIITAVVVGKYIGAQKDNR